MKISEVVEALRAEFPALSVSKLRYLETEGLISPHRIGNGYRRYSQADVARLRFALTAQRDEYLPLGVIRERLEDMDASASAPDPAPVARVVASQGRAVEGTDMSLDDLRALTGASEADINELISAGLIAADARGRFAPQSLRITRLALEAARLGLPLRNLRSCAPVRRGPRTPSTRPRSRPGGARPQRPRTPRPSSRVSSASCMGNCCTWPCAPCPEPSHRSSVPPASLRSPVSR